MIATQDDRILFICWNLEMYLKKKKKETTKTTTTTKNTQQNNIQILCFIPKKNVRSQTHTHSSETRARGFSGKYLFSRMTSYMHDTWRLMALFLHDFQYCLIFSRLWNWQWCYCAVAVLVVVVVIFFTLINISPVAHFHCCCCYYHILIEIEIECK